MSIIGVMDCANQQEYDRVLERLRGIQFVNINTNNLTVIVEYAAKDIQTSSEEKRTVAMLQDLIQSVEIHGYSFLE